MITKNTIQKQSEAIKLSDLVIMKENPGISKVFDKLETYKKGKSMPKKF